MDDCFYGIEGIPLVMYIQPYIFEPQAVCVDRENPPQSSKESKSDTDDISCNRRNKTM